MGSSGSNCPYIGLQPYTEEDQALFFGRERDRRIIISNLYAAPLTILYGASGVGKSSVLFAGVVPDLKKEPNTIVIVFRNWHDPLFLTNLKGECIRAVESVLKKKLGIDISSPLDELILNLSKLTKSPIFILFDQFEEYFSYHPEVNVSEGFDIEFARTINRQDIDAGFLIVLREDGLYRLDRFKMLIPGLFDNTLSLKHLDFSAAEDAIRKPLDKYNELNGSSKKHFKIEDKLVGEIIRQVRLGKVNMGQNDNIRAENKIKQDAIKTERIETAFLQLVMTRLWDAKATQDTHIISNNTLKKLGGAENIVRSHLDTVLNDFDNEKKKELCSILFDRFVTPSGTKIALHENDLANYAGDLRYYLPDVLDTLIKKRILRCIPAPLDQTQRSCYEIYHDLLAIAILDWQTRFKVKIKVKDIRKSAFVASRNYNRLRISIGLLFVSFPIIMFLGTWISGEFKIPNTLSDYYHTNMRDFFVGMLAAISVLFLSYSGYSPTDYYMSKLASILLIGVTIFPGAILTFHIGSIIHDICFSLFLITQVYFSLFLFTKSAYTPTIEKLKRNRLYRICGYTILCCLFLIALLPAIFPHYSFTLSLESLSFFAIGTTWLTKGKTIFSDRSELSGSDKEDY